MRFRKRGQSALEYLLILVTAILLSSFIIYVARTFLGANQASISQNSGNVNRLLSTTLPILATTSTTNPAGGPPLPGNYILIGAPTSLNGSGNYYGLGHSINFGGAAGNAMLLNQSNVVFDCNGNSFNGFSFYTQGDAFLVVNANNVTVKNCVINGFTIGIYLNQSSNDLILNNTITGSDSFRNDMLAGVLLYGGANDNVSSNVITSYLYGINESYSISANTSYNLLQSNNNSLNLEGDASPLLFGNTANTSSLCGILIQDSMFDNVSGNIISYSQLCGIKLSNSTFNYVYNNTIQSNCVLGWNGTYPSYCPQAWVYSSLNTTFFQDSVVNGSLGLSLDSSNFSTVNYSSFSSIYANDTFCNPSCSYDTSFGLRSVSSTNFLIQNNSFTPPPTFTVTPVTSYGLYLQDSNTFTLRGNYLTQFNEGLATYGLVNNTLMEQNVFYNTSLYLSSNLSNSSSIFRFNILNYSSGPVLVANSFNYSSIRYNTLENNSVAVAIINAKLNFTNNIVYNSTSGYGVYGQYSNASMGWNYICLNTPDLSCTSSQYDLGSNSCGASACGIACGVCGAVPTINQGSDTPVVQPGS